MLLLSLALPALAAPEAAPREDVTLEGRLIRYRERDEIDFEELEVSATVQRPGVIAVTEHYRPGFRSLVKIREDWNDEVASSVDEVK